MCYFIVGLILSDKKYDSNVPYKLKKKTFSTRMSHSSIINVVLSVGAKPFFF